MNVYCLQRTDIPKFKISELRGKTKWICTYLLVVAPSEVQARELAARPRPTFGKEVSESNTESNTIDVPYAWCYDSETGIWADPALSSCKLVGDDPADKPPRLGISQFTEVPRDWQTSRHETDR